MIIQQKATQRALETGDLADKKILHPKDRIRAVLEGYLPTAVKKTNFLITLLEDMETSFNNCLIYYCEEPKDPMSRSQFFQKFDIFIKDYRRVKKENFEMEEEAHRAEMRRKALFKAGQKNILDQAMNQSPNHAVMDNLLEKLRVGPDPEARRTRKKNMLPARRAPLATMRLTSATQGISVSGQAPQSGLAIDQPSTVEVSDDTVKDKANETPVSTANNAVLAAKAQSMLAGLRSGKVVKRNTGEPLSPSAVSDVSPIRFGLAKALPDTENPSDPVKQPDFGTSDGTGAEKTETKDEVVGGATESSRSQDLDQTV